mgnify:CR=1 FL=1
MDPIRKHSRVLVALLLWLVATGAKLPAQPGIPVPPSKGPQLPPQEVENEGFPKGAVGKPASRIVISTTSVTPVVYSQITGFTGGGSMGWKPPDPHGAIGPKGILHSVNSGLGFMYRDGSSVWTQSLYDFFVPAGAVYNPVDPKVLYDAAAGRYFVIGIEPLCSASYLDVAVSKDDDPETNGSSDWYWYRFDVTQNFSGSNYGFDYPCVGFDHQAFYVTAQMRKLPFYSFCGAVNPAFQNVAVVMFDKSALMNGTASGFNRVNTPNRVNNGSNLQPASLIGTPNAGNVGYFADIVWNDNTKIRIWAVSDPLGTPSLSSATVTVPSHGEAVGLRRPA